MWAMTETWTLVLGGTASVNLSSVLLLDSCAGNGLSATNTIEKDFRLREGSGKQLGSSGEGSSVSLTLCGSEALLTSTGDVIGKWKEYVKDLLSPTNVTSQKKQIWGDSELSNRFVYQISGSSKH